MWEIGAGGEGAKVSWGSGGMSKGEMGAMCRVSFSKMEHEGGGVDTKGGGRYGPGVMRAASPKFTAAAGRTSNPIILEIRF